MGGVRRQRRVDQIPRGAEEGRLPLRFAYRLQNGQGFVAWDGGFELCVARSRRGHLSHARAAHHHEGGAVLARWLG